MKTGESRRLIILISILLVAGFLATSLASYFVSKAAVREAIIARELPITSDNIYSEIQRDLLRPISISSFTQKMQLSLIFSGNSFIDS